MVRKKKHKMRTTRSRMARKMSHRRKKSSGFTGDLMSVAGGVAYGGIREYTSNQLASLTKGASLNFIGEYSDELSMGLLSWALAKGKIPFLNKFKVLREVGKAGLYIESARVGGQLIAPMLQGSTATGNGSGNIF